VAVLPGRCGTIHLGPDETAASFLEYSRGMSSPAKLPDIVPVADLEQDIGSVLQRIRVLSEADRLLVQRDD
jgi:hypothetical protein